MINSAFTIAAVALCLTSSTLSATTAAKVNPKQCSTYNQGNTTTAQCNDYPLETCNTCDGKIVADSCFLKDGDTPGPQTCTIAWGKSSATQYICGNEKGYYTCTGSHTGQGTCYDCKPTNATTSVATDTKNATTTINTPSSPDTGATTPAPTDNPTDNTGATDTTASTSSTTPATQGTPSSPPANTPTNTSTNTTGSASSMTESYKTIVFVASAALGALVL